MLTAIGLQIAALNCYAQQAKVIRVSIIQDTASLRLKVEGYFNIFDLNSGKLLYRGKDLNTTVTAYNSGILLGRIRTGSNKVLVKPEAEKGIIINGRIFRGDIGFIKEGNSHLTTVNHLGVEDYIQGILYHEASHYWPMEALKAQAVVCRTYAFYQMQHNADKKLDFDLTSDMYSQVYGGRASERYRTNKAVEETKGQVLFYDGKIFPAYFHATCGGYTEDASNLWNINIAVLKGVPCGFCKDSPHFNWHQTLSLGEIKEKLQEAGYKIRDVKGILTGERNRSGRLVNLVIIGSPKNLDMLAKDFRNVIGPNSIRSTNFSVKVIENDAVFEGLGWGHGAGLCQWGAYFMAKEGKGYKEILEYYYPGAKISLTANR